MYPLNPHRLRSVFLPALLTGAVLTAGQAAMAEDAGKKNAVRLYRYTNEKGVMVTGSSIKPEFARKGYQVVTMSGAVLETIPPEPTAEERIRYEQEKQNQLSAVQQVEADKQLLLRYSTADEIHLAKERKLAEIDDKVKMLKSNISTLEQQIAAEQKKAAGFERNGTPVPQVLLDKINSLQQETKVSQEQLSSREAEYASEGTRFDHDYERYLYLEKKHGKVPPPASHP